jgi:hypothetical protein
MFNLSTANKLYNIREDGILLYFLLRNNLIEWLSPTSAKLREIKQIGSKLSNLVLKDEIKVLFWIKGYSRDKRKFCYLSRKKREFFLYLLSKVGLSPISF